jgi:hypothetical protein
MSCPRCKHRHHDEHETMLCQAGEIEELREELHKLRMPDFAKRDLAIKFLNDKAIYHREDRNGGWRCDYFYAGAVLNIFGELLSRINEAEVVVDSAKESGVTTALGPHLKACRYREKYPKEVP